MSHRAINSVDISFRLQKHYCNVSGDTIAAFPDLQFKLSTYHTETELSDQTLLLHLFEKRSSPATVIEQVPIVVGGSVRGHVSNEISPGAISQLLQLDKTPSEQRTKDKTNYSNSDNCHR